MGSGGGFLSLFGALPYKAEQAEAPPRVRSGAEAPSSPAWCCPCSCQSPKGNQSLGFVLQPKAQAWPLKALPHLLAWGTHAGWDSLDSSGPGFSTCKVLGEGKTPNSSQMNDITLDPQPLGAGVGGPTQDSFIV